MKSLYRRFIRWLNEPVFPEPWKSVPSIDRTDQDFAAGEYYIHIANYATCHHVWIGRKAEGKHMMDHHIILTPIQERDMP
jgi:hypothetical protein